VEPPERLRRSSVRGACRTLSRELRLSRSVRNQSIDESNADLAHDLCGSAATRLVAGDSDRGADYVSPVRRLLCCRPPSAANLPAVVTPACWYWGPAGCSFAGRAVAEQVLPPLTQDEKARAKLLLGDPG